MKLSKIKMKLSKKNIKRVYKNYKKWFDSLPPIAACAFQRWVFVNYGKWLYDMSEQEQIQAWNVWQEPPF